MQSHSELIKKLGGGTAVAAAIWGEGATTKQRDAVYKWKLNGVPWRYRQTVATLARKKKLSLPPSFWVPGHDGPSGSNSLQAAE